MDNYTFRLKPGDDPSGSINSFVRGKNIEAGCVLDRRFVLAAFEDAVCKRERFRPWGPVPFACRNEPCNFVI
jgi:hypothetical protein